MTMLRVHGVEATPAGKFHILHMEEDKATGQEERRRFCGRGSPLHKNRQHLAVADEKDFCADCLRAYATWRRRYGYGPIEAA